jgi:nucleotide-binding universal stress UspA family protein
MVKRETNHETVSFAGVYFQERTGIAKYLIGSAARNVVNGSQCPTLVIK